MTKNVSALVRQVLAAVVLACLAGMPPLTPAFAADSEREHMARALGFEDTGDLGSAIIEYKNTLRVNPDNVGARVRLGRLQLVTGKLIEAQKNMEQALERGASRDALLIDLAQTYLRSHEYGRLLDFLLATDGNTLEQQAQVLTLRGYAQIGLEDHATARASFEAALDRIPGYTSALIGLGQIAVESGDLEQIQAVVEQGRGIQSTDTYVWVLMGQLEQRSNHFSSAADAFEKALASDPNETAAQLGMATTRFAQGRSKEARQWAERVAENFPANPEANILLARIAIIDRQLPVARDRLRVVNELAPDRLDAVLLYASVSYDLREYEQALGLVKHYLSLSKQHLPARKLLAMIQMANRSPDDALWGLEPLVSQFPDDGQLLGLLIKAAILSDKMAQARVYADQALETSLPDPLRAQMEDVRSLLSKTQTARQAIPALDLLIADYRKELMALEMRTAMDDLEAQNFAGVRAHARALAKARPSDPAGHLLLGLAAYSEGDQQAARESIEAVLQVDRNNIDALNALGNLDVLEGQPGAASLRFARVLDLDSRNYVALMGSARVAAMEGRRAQAIETLERARRNFPGAPAPRLVLGWIYFRGGEIEQAGELVHELEALAADDSKVLDLRGTVAAARGDFDSALIDLQAAAKEEPNAVGMLYRLAFVQSAAGRIDAASETYRSILKLDPSASKAASRLVELELAQERPARAFAAARSVRANRPAYSRMLEGDIEREQGAGARALVSYLKATSEGQAFPPARKQALAELLVPRFEAVALVVGQQQKAIAGLKRLAPDSAEVKDLEGRFVISQHGPAAGAKYYRRVSRRESDKLLWALRVAAAQREAGDKLASLKTLEGWLQRHPDNARGHLALAEQLASEGMIPEAVQHYQRIVELEPNNVLALNNVAWLSVDNDPGRALKYAARAAKLDNNPSILHTLGRVLLKTGQVTTAVAVLEQATSAAPDNPDIAFELAVALVESGREDEARTLLAELLARPAPFKTRGSAESLARRLDRRNPSRR